MQQDYDSCCGVMYGFVTDGHCASCKLQALSKACCLAISSTPIPAHPLLLQRQDMAPVPSRGNGTWSVIQQRPSFVASLTVLTEC